MVCVGPDAFPQACIANISEICFHALSCSIASWQLAVASHRLELPETRSALSAFRSAVTNHQASDQSYNTISDWWLAWWFFCPYNHFPVQSFSASLVKHQTMLLPLGPQILKGCMTFPSLKETFLRKDLVSTPIRRHTCLDWGLFMQRTRLLKGRVCPCWESLSW